MILNVQATVQAESFRQAFGGLMDMDYHISHIGDGLNRETSHVKIAPDGDDLIVTIRLGAQKVKAPKSPRLTENDALSNVSEALVTGGQSEPFQLKRREGVTVEDVMPTAIAAVMAQRD